MASEARIAANRRNAQNSTGPRSASGKKRASRSALRHGLSKPMSGLAFAREVEALAHGGQKGKVRPEKVLASGRPEFIYRPTEHRRNKGQHFRWPNDVRHVK
jgi:hypothetical protein